MFSILKALGIGTGDRVIIPGYTSVATANVVRYSGATPEYTDIDPMQYNSLLNNYETTYQRLEKAGLAGQLKCVIIQHTYGNINRDSRLIEAWAREKGLFVVENCDHVSINDEQAGTMGDAAVFSTNRGKPYSTGLGGIVRVNNDRFARMMKCMERAAVAPSFSETLQAAARYGGYCLLTSKLLYQYTALFRHNINTLDVGKELELDGTQPNGFFKRMGWLQRKILEITEATSTKIDEHRRSLTKYYNTLLTEYGLPVFDCVPDSVLLRYPVRVQNKPACLAMARRCRVDLGDWYSHPLHPAGAFLDGLNWDEINCGFAVEAAQFTVTMPLHNRIDDKAARRIVEFIAGYRMLATG